MNIKKIDEAIKQVCPIHGVNSSGVISFKEEATEEGKAAALSLYAQLTSPEGIAAEEASAVKDKIKEDMAAIESQYFMTRGEREGWLALMLNTATGQGMTEAQLYAANPFYKKLKDANDAIAALRAQL